MELKEGQSVNTGLKIRGFEVWACTPHHDRHYHTLFLRIPGEFPTESYEESPGRWVVGFTQPDGKRRSTYGIYDSRKEAEDARTTYSGATTATLGCQFEVGYKLTDENGEYLHSAFASASDPTAKPWGTTWANPEYDYAPLAFDLTADEAAQVIAWRDQADKEWFAASPDFLLRERTITDAQVRGLSETAAEFVVDAAAFAGLDVAILPARETPTALECLECGAIYNEPGHVEWGGMACDRCA